MRAPVERRPRKPATNGFVRASTNDTISVSDYAVRVMAKRSNGSKQRII